jgi:hypothetical protein
MAPINKLTTLLEKLIADGEKLLTSTSRTSPRSSVQHVNDTDGLFRWASELRLLKSLAGNLILPWRDQLQHNGIVTLSYELNRCLIALKTIQFALKSDLLVRFEDLVIAEAFANLTEQSKYLLAQGYFLAAGVIMRAVLEEKLRNMCLRHSCPLAKRTPTIADFNQALYTASPPVYDKTLMFHVTAMAAVGNDAAHNNPALKREDVERLARDVPEFLAKFSA